MPTIPKVDRPGSAQLLEEIRGLRLAVDRLLNAVLDEHSASVAAGHQTILSLIAREVCTGFGICADQLPAVCRRRSIVLPRSVAWMLARKHTSLSLAELGSWLAHPGRGTTAHSLRTLESDLATDPRLRQLVSHISASVLAKLSQPPANPPVLSIPRCNPELSA